MPVLTYHQARGISGLPGGAKQCQPIWDEFVSNREELLFESERILAELENQSIEVKYSESLQDILEMKGETKVREVKTRVNQNVFRQIILSNYSGKFATSGIDISEFLVASHIIPWSKNEKERLNPENGICLSSLFDKAYDKGYIGISTKHQVLLSRSLTDNSEKDFYTRFFAHLKDSKIQLPERFLPKKEFLEYHLDVIYKGESIIFVPTEESLNKTSHTCGATRISKSDISRKRGVYPDSTSSESAQIPFIYRFNLLEDCKFKK